MSPYEPSEASVVGVDGCPGTITIARAGPTITALDLEGEFDISLSPQIIDEAERALDNDQHLIINLSNATFIDSSVVHALFEARMQAEERGRRFVLQIGTASGVERVLSITGARTVLVTASRRAEAINLIQQDTPTD